MARTTTPRGDRTGGARLTAEQRRRQLAEAAARRFHRHGFHAVALADVAADVGVTAPAVYRHFRNKKALLAGAIESGLDLADADLLVAGESLDHLLLALAGAALDRRDMWVLVQREMRHLDGEEFAAVKARFNGFVARFSERLHAARPDADPGQLALLVTAVFAVLTSPSISRVRMPEAAYRRLLTAAAAATARAELPAPAPAPDSQVPTRVDRRSVPVSRSEELLETAVELFHDRGYAAVSLDDIGAAVGMAGPSIYHHFETKSELLVTAVTRVARRLTAARPYDDGAGAPDILQELVRSYIRVGVEQRHLFGVYVTEAISLPPDARRRIDTELAASVREWSAALRSRRPELSAAQSQALVYAARAIVNDVVRVGQLHTRPRTEPELQVLLGTVLDTELP
ncbi:hypothetical protein AQJ46_47660 [Streptomyces canus]|uniref:HTH tetR-type domain-containing protein n=1 Tax=Streptomyces canus TaxID=58343 RepID=A0A101RKT6_9ACTN|nr:TetR/AcrR family transcriptional regulator [Streptomyces canus]KUN57422.1 hypothetical protein AQJ46_47660 [Streptomyces canus]